MQTRTSQARDALFISMWTYALHAERIGAALDLKQAAVYAYAKRLRLPRRDAIHLDGEAVAQQWLAGVPAQQIAGQFGVSRTRTNAEVQRFGLPFRKVQGGADERRAKIIAMTAEGASLADIADAVGITRSGVVTIRVALGISPPRRRAQGKVA